MKSLSSQFFVTVVMLWLKLFISVYSRQEPESEDADESLGVFGQRGHKNSFSVSNVRDGDDLALYCPLPDELDKRNDTLVEWYQPNGDINQSKGCYVKNVTGNNIGTYVCKWYSDDSRKMYASASFTVDKLDPKNYLSTITAGGHDYLIGVQPLENEILKPGGYARRVCVAYSPTDKLNNKFTYEWRHDSRSKPIKVTKDVTFAIGKKALNGTLTCIMKFIADPTAVMEHRTKMYFQEPLKESEYKMAPKLMINFDSFTPPYRVRCDVDPTTLEDTPKPVINFTYNFKVDEDPQADHDGTNVLRTNKLGTYECEGVGTIGGEKWKLTTKKTAKLEESKRLALSEENEIHTGKVKGRKELHCELDQNAETSELDTVEWFFQPTGEPKPLSLKSPPNTFSNSESVSILVKTDLKVKDSGLYICYIVRNGTRLRREATLVVLAPPGELEVEPKLITWNKRHNNVPPEYHCQIEHIDVKPENIQWTFIPEDDPEQKERELPPNVKKFEKPEIDESSFIRITKPTAANAGTYVCRVPDTKYTDSGVYKYPPEGRTPEVILQLKPDPIIKQPVGDRARLLCLDIGPQQVTPEWSFNETLKSRAVNEVTGKNRIFELPNLQVEDNNTEVVCHYQGKYNITAKIIVTLPCPIGQRQCRNEKCISESLFCDGKPDCEDNSDEDDRICGDCKPNEKRCKTYQNVPPTLGCVLQHWICDGEDDCGNGFDESACPDPCNDTYFSCSNETIVRGFLCDKEKDCPNGEDENCVPSSFLIPSGSTPVRIEVEKVGDSVTLECVATGKERPTISWRYNWGHVLDAEPDPSKCDEQDPDKISSSITIKNFDPAKHSGYYTCEAVNRERRSFSQDYSVLLKGSDLTTISEIQPTEATSTKSPSENEI